MFCVDVCGVMQPHTREEVWLYFAVATLKHYYNDKVIANLVYTHRPFMGIVPARKHKWLTSTR